MDSTTLLGILFFGSVAFGLWSYFNLESNKLRKQVLMFSILTFIVDWWLESWGGRRGAWSYDVSLFFLPGGVPIEVPGLYAFFIPIWVYLMQLTYQSNIDSILQFGAPELLIAVGFVLAIIDGAFFYFIIFVGIAGLLVATRKTLVILLGVAAGVGDYIIEGIFMVNNGLIDWSGSGGYDIIIAVEIMFAVFALGGYLSSPRTRLVK